MNRTLVFFIILMVLVSTMGCSGLQSTTSPVQSNTTGSAETVRYDGLYIAKAGSTQWDYLRFYDDGTVAYVPTNSDDAESIANWFSKDQENVAVGTYELTGSHIKCDFIKNVAVGFNLDGTVQGETLSLKENTNQGTYILVFTFVQVPLGK
jgi:uncharacterized protein YceK